MSLQAAFDALTIELAGADHDVDVAVVRRAAIAEVHDALYVLLGLDGSTAKPAAVVVRDTPKKTSAPKKLTHKCPDCPKVFETVQALNGHISSHRVVVKQPCPNGCGAMFAGAGMAKHLQAGRCIPAAVVVIDPDTDAFVKVVIPVVPPMPTNIEAFGDVVEHPTEVEVLACLDCDFTTDSLERGVLAKHTLEAHDRAPMFAERQPELRPRSDAA